MKDPVSPLFREISLRGILSYFKLCLCLGSLVMQKLSDEKKTEMANGECQSRICQLGNFGILAVALVVILFLEDFNFITGEKSEGKFSFAQAGEALFFKRGRFNNIVIVLILRYCTKDRNNEKEKNNIVVTFL